MGHSEPEELFRIIKRGIVMQDKIFTVIICTYNGERTLKNTIESVLRQDEYSSLVDKLILVDNNSNDKTKEIIDNYISINKNIVYSFEKNPGLSNARLNGVKQAQSEWIVFVDDDNELQDSWLVQAKIFIGSNQNMGAFNGAVIPKCNFVLSNSEKSVLNAIYKGLACTHLSSKNINVNVTEHPNGFPFGAGLVIRTSCLKKLASTGWLNLLGRTKDNLAAGEDGEMCGFVFKQGFDMGYNPKMLLHHDIPRARLSEEYAIKLYRGFAYSTYISSTYKSLYILRRIRHLFVAIKNLVKNKKLLKECNDNIMRIKLQIGIENSKVFITCILKDYIVLKR